MNRNSKIRLLRLILVIGLALGVASGLAPSAMAYPISAPLPTTKEPSSVRFTLAGNISTSSPESAQATINMGMTGDGALANSRVQENITMALSGENLPSGSNLSITTNVIYADGKYYFKTSGLSTEGQDKWYVMDMSKMPGGQQSMNSSNLMGVDPKYAEAFSSQEVGKEAINGTPTTKHQVDVDLQKLYSLMGMADPTITEMAKDSKMVLYMWVGDNDQYLYQERMTYDMKISVPADSATGSGQSSLNMAMDLTIMFKDFNMPITIDVPANAEPIDSMESSGSTTVMGVPTSFNLINSVTSMPSSNMPTGMPRTGTGTSSNGLPLAAVALALVCIAAGSLVRRPTTLQ